MMYVHSLCNEEGVAMDAMHERTSMISVHRGQHRTTSIHRAYLMTSRGCRVTPQKTPAAAPANRLGIRDDAEGVEEEDDGA